MLLKLILMGPPGAGKGTQAKSICNKYLLPHISTGDIFRKDITDSTPLGLEVKKDIEEGQLVPDNLTIDVILNRLKEDDCRTGFLLDGYPRTVNQAIALDTFLKGKNEKIDNVLLIQVPKDFVIDRMTGRRVCPSCGASYHLKYNPPIKEGICDVCGSDIVQRKDDIEETVKERLEVYEDQTKPLVNYYNEQNLLTSIDGTLTINDIFTSICGILGES
jgi:adenylate kinase